MVVIESATEYLCLPKIYIMEHNPNVYLEVGLWRRIGHKGRALVNGISGLIKQAPGSALTLSAM